MTEQQLETTGCKRCGEEVELPGDDYKNEYCDHCFYIIDRAGNDFRMTQLVISKLIYDLVSKADLVLFYTIMNKVAKNDFLASFELNETNLANELKLQQSNSSRSIKKLVNSGLLIKNENTYSFGISNFIYTAKSENASKS